MVRGFDEILRVKRSDVSSDSDDEGARLTRLSTDLMNCIRDKKPLGDIERLVSQGADVNFVDKNDRDNTPLHLAARKGMGQVVKFLLEKGAHAGVKNAAGKTPSDVSHKNENIVHILKQNMEEKVKIEHKSEGEVAGAINVRNEEAPSGLDSDTAKTISTITETFDRRGGTAGMGGQLYEIKLSVLHLLRGLTKVNRGEINRFYLASNVEGAGAFDDVVFKYSYRDKNDEEKSKVIFLQAKHKDEADKHKLTMIELLKSSAKSDFGLVRYFKSYQEIRRKFSDGNSNPLFAGKFDGQDCEFVIFTNALPDFPREKLSEKVIDQSDILNLSSKKELGKESAGQYYKLYENERLKSGLVKAYPESAAEIQDFLTKLRVFVGQPDERELEEIIRQDIQSKYAVQEHDVKSVSSLIIKEVENWWRQTGSAPFLSEKSTLVRDAVRIEVMFDVRDPVPSFTGRERELRELHDALQKNKEDGAYTILSQKVSVSGMGGVGKSELTRKYISEHAQSYDYNVFWIDAESRTSLSDSFYRLADKLNISTQDDNGQQRNIRDIVAFIYSFFAKRKSLFVFDNAAKLRSSEGNGDDGIADFLPQNRFSGAPSILITSRNKKWGKYVSVIELEVFTKEEAYDFIRKSLHDIVEEESFHQDANKLAEELQYFPLALQQAVAYIREQDEILKNVGKRYKISDYLEMYKNEAKAPLDYPIPEDSFDVYTLTTFRTWDITVKAIRSKKNGILAQDILETMSYFAPNNIPVDTFLKFVGNNDFTLASAVQLLKQYSMVSFEQSDLTLSVHRLVQQVTRFKLDDESRSQQTIGEGLKLMLSILHAPAIKRLPQYITHSISAWNYAKESDNLVREYSELPSYIVNSLNEIGRYDESSRVGTETVGQLGRVLATDHSDILDVKMGIADSYLHAGNYERALEAYKEGLAKDEELLGPDHPDTLTTRNNIAVIYKRQGKYDLALEEYHKVLEKRQKVLGPNHRDTLKTLSNIAVTLSSQGKHHEALDAYKEILKRREETLGPDHPDTLMTWNNIAGTLDSLGKYGEAFEVYQRVLKVQEEMLGPNHPGTLTVRNNMAVNLDNQGKYDQALRAYQEVLEMRQEVLGVDHPDTLNTRSSIAGTLASLGKYDMALEVYKEVLHKQGKTLGLDHPRALNTRNKIGVMLGHLEKHDEALKVYKDVLEKRKDVLGPNHPETLNTRNNIAAALDREGKYDQALKEYAEIAEKLEAIFGPDHPDYLAVRNNIAGTLYSQGKYTEALEEYRRALQKQEEALGFDHPDTLATRSNIIVTLDAMGKYEESLRLYKDVLTKQEQVLGPDHPNTLALRGIIARELLIRGNYDDVLSEYRKTFEGFVNKKVALRDMALIQDIVINTLLEIGAHINVRDIINLSYEDTTNFNAVCEIITSTRDLCAEVERGDITKVEDLLNQGAIVDAPDGKSGRALIYAARKGNEEMVRFLLKSGANPDVADNNGDTPLHVASKLGRLHVVKLLLENKADQSLTNKKGETPLDAAQELRNRDMETYENVMSLLVGQYGGAEGGEVSAKNCLTGAGSGRKKRNAESPCLFTWEDVDEFNGEMFETRATDKIKIDSEKFINYIRDLPTSKQYQLIDLAKQFEISGDAKHLVDKLLKRRTLIEHLNKVGRVSGLVMHGMMVKSMVSDFLSGDCKGVAINLGFMLGGPGMARVADAAGVKGAELMSKGRRVLGRSLKAASPFLARGTSAFVIYDLVNQIKAYQRGEAGAGVGVAGDGIYLGLDAAEIGVEVAEAMGVLEGVSSVTGPIGAAIGAVIFVGTDIYTAVKKTEAIDQAVHLSRTERLVEGLRAFMGMQPQKRIRDAMEEKQINSQLVKQGLDYLTESGIQTYVFPTGFLATISCRNVHYHRYVGMGPNAALLRGSCPEDGSISSYCVNIQREKCERGIQLHANNMVELDKKHFGVMWSRSIPDDPVGGELTCLQTGEYDAGAVRGAYLCDTAIGVTLTEKAGIDGNYTVINLGEGDDYAKGFENSPNIFLVGSGHKMFYGGNEDDTFALHGDITTGLLHGVDGNNILDLSVFAANVSDVTAYVNLRSGTVGHSRYDNDRVLKIGKMKRVFGRKGKPDHMTCSCDTLFVNGNGGSESRHDLVLVENVDYCNYGMRIVISPNTDVVNMAKRGNFTYLVNLQAGVASVRLPLTMSTRHNFMFNYSLSDVASVDVQNDYIRSTLNFRFASSGANFSASVSRNYRDNEMYSLNDGTELRIGRDGSLYAIQATNKSVEEVVTSYPSIATRLNAVISVLTHNQSIVVGHGKHEVLHNNPGMESHLIGNGGENVYAIISGGTDQSGSLNIPRVTLYDVDSEHDIDTLDLRLVKKEMIDTCRTGVDKKTKLTGKDLTINMSCCGSLDTSLTVVLKDSLMSNWHERLQVILDNVPMKIEDFELKPVPLVFGEESHIIVITPQEVSEGTAIAVSHRSGNYTFARAGENLVITNSIDFPSVDESEMWTIYLQDYYLAPLMQSLSIKFGDEYLKLKDELEKISSATSLSEYLSKYGSISSLINTATESQIFPGHKPKKYFAANLRKSVHFADVNVKEENLSNSANIQSSWINNVANGFVSCAKNFIGMFWSGRFKSISSLAFDNNALENQLHLDHWTPEDGTTSPDYPSHYNFSLIDTSSTLFLLDLIIRKITREKYVYPSEHEMSLEEAQGCSLVIVEEFERTLACTCADCGMSLSGLHFDPVTLQSRIIKFIRNGQYSKIFQELHATATTSLSLLEHDGKFKHQLLSHKLITMLNHTDTKFNRKLTISQ